MENGKKAVMVLMTLIIGSVMAFASTEENMLANDETVNNSDQRINIFIEANKKIENAVVSSYKAVENSVVSGYRALENWFVKTFLPKDFERPEVNLPVIDIEKYRYSSESYDRYRYNPGRTTPTD